MNAPKDTGTVTVTSTITTPKASVGTTDHSADALAGKWKQQVGNAKILWGKLTDDELLKTEGHIQHLTGLVQERYAVTRDAAEKQVNDFFAQFKK